MIHMSYTGLPKQIQVYVPGHDFGGKPKMHSNVLER